MLRPAVLSVSHLRIQFLWFDWTARSISSHISEFVPCAKQPEPLSVFEVKGALNESRSSKQQSDLSKFIHTVFILLLFDSVIFVFCYICISLVFSITGWVIAPYGGGWANLQN